MDAILVTSAGGKYLQVEFGWINRYDRPERERKVYTSFIPTADYPGIVGAPLQWRNEQRVYNVCHTAYRWLSFNLADTATWHVLLEVEPIDPPIVRKKYRHLYHYEWRCGDWCRMYDYDLGKKGEKIL